MLIADASDARSGHDHHPRCHPGARRQRMPRGVDGGGTDQDVCRGTWRNPFRAKYPATGVAVLFRTLRLGVVMRLYRMRFSEELDDSLTLEQIRGKEGVPVRQAYVRASAATGVPWAGRSYKRDQWNYADPVNRALSAANSCLYGICHAAIVSAGYSPALGFIHTGKMLSFVYDVADLYKTEVAILAAFHMVAEGIENLESRVRHACRDLFRTTRLLQRIVPDIERALGAPDVGADHDFDSDPAVPGSLWDDRKGEVAGGVNRGEPDAEEPKGGKD